MTQSMSSNSAGVLPIVMHGNNMFRTANQHAKRAAFQADMQREVVRRKEDEIRRQQEKERLRRDEEEERRVALGHGINDTERLVASERSSGSQAPSLWSLARQEGLKDSDEAAQVASALIISSKHKAWPSQSAVVLVNQLLHLLQSCRVND